MLAARNALVTTMVRWRAILYLFLLLAAAALAVADHTHRSDSILSPATHEAG